MDWRSTKQRHNETLVGIGAAFFGALGLLALAIGHFLEALIALSIAARFAWELRTPQRRPWDSTPATPAPATEDDERVAEDEEAPSGVRHVSRGWSKRYALDLAYARDRVTSDVEVFEVVLYDDQGQKVAKAKSPSKGLKVDEALASVSGDLENFLRAGN